MRDPTNNPPPIAAILTTLALVSLILGAIFGVKQ